MNKVNPENYHISISPLADIIRNEKIKFDDFQMQIFEEVFYLCVNDNFIKDVWNIRKEITKKHPNKKIPTTDTEEAEEIVRLLYLKNYRFYKEKMESLLKKYKLIHPLYWDNKLKWIEVEEIELAIIFKKKPRINLSNNKEAQKKLECYPSNLLDNIVFRNSPFQKDDGLPFWNNSYFTRKTMPTVGNSYHINYDGYAPKLTVSFPVYASLTEMKKILADNYGEIKKYRAEKLPLSDKKDYRKNELSKSIDAYSMSVLGKNFSQIAYELDKKYAGMEHNIDSVRKLIKRLKKESERFNK
jgi:hypothetical protein